MPHQCLLMVFALLLVTGCKGEKKIVEETLPPVLYQCGNKQMQAVFTKSNKVTLQVMGKTYSLLPVAAASGAKYETPKDARPYALFWSKGGEALTQTMETGQIVCKVVKIKTAPAAAKSPAAPATRK